VTIALVPLAREHVPAVEALFDDPDVLRFTRLPEPPPPDFAAELGALRLELPVGVENHASKRVAERNGYRLEGVLRSLYFKQGVREDTELWSRLPGD
jgi:hypothetical protein